MAEPERVKSFNWFGWWSIVAIDLILISAWILLAARISGGKSDFPWTILWLFPTVAVLTRITAVMMFGLRATTYATLVAVTAIGMTYQVHAGFRLTYLDGDVPYDTLIYNTTSPDINQLAADLKTLSWLSRGDLDLQVQIEVCNSLQWPFHWYLRDMPHVSYLTSIPDDAGRLAPVIVGSLPEWSQGECSMPALIPGYAARQIVLRWHEPEWAVYREFAIAPEIDPGWSAWKQRDDPHGPGAVFHSVLNSFGWAISPAGQERLFELLMYRRTGAPLATFYVNVYIRNDLLPAYNGIRYGV